MSKTRPKTEPKLSPERWARIAASLDAKLVRGPSPMLFKGSAREYNMLHRWVARNLGKPSECENCGRTDATKYHWANISGEYLWDLSDWARLCPNCHALIDARWRYREEGEPFSSWLLKSLRNDSPEERARRLEIILLSHGND